MSSFKTVSSVYNNYSCIAGVSFSFLANDWILFWTGSFGSILWMQLLDFFTKIQQIQPLYKKDKDDINVHHHSLWINHSRWQAHPRFLTGAVNEMRISKIMPSFAKKGDSQEVRNQPQISKACNYNPSLKSFRPTKVWSSIHFKYLK
jgi:hypothetical protein